ncbi:neuroguidin [Vipera latastei]
MAERLPPPCELMDSRDIVEADLPAALTLFKSLQEQVVAVTHHVQRLVQKVRAGEYPTEKGLSFLEVKDHLLLLYLQDLSHLMLEKTSGRSVANHPALLRLVETRTVLEKMRPIEQKLKYQVDKLLKAAVTGGLDENDPLKFKPNPDNLISKLSDSEDGEEEEDVGGAAKTPGKDVSKGGIRKYVPPRLVPVHYNETEMEREKKMAEQAKKRALSSSIIRELKEQYSDAPEEIREGHHAHTARQNREDEHRTNYEESMMVRLNVSRKEKARRRRGGVLGSQLSSLTHFRDISALTGATPSLGEDLNPPKKRRKKISTKRGKKKGFRKRR